MHWFCPYDCICFAGVTAIVQYDYTILTATLLLQGHASRNDSWYRARTNHVMNVHGQITVQIIPESTGILTIIVWREVPLPSFLSLLHSSHL